MTGEDGKTNNVRFVSNARYYDEEASGRKPYTIRDVRTLPDSYRKKIIAFMERGARLTITISRGYTKTTITNDCTHALFWGDWVILAWSPVVAIRDGVESLPWRQLNKAMYVHRDKVLALLKKEEG